MVSGIFLGLNALDHGQSVAFAVLLGLFVSLAGTLTGVMLALPLLLLWFRLGKKVSLPPKPGGSDDTRPGD